MGKLIVLKIGGGSFEQGFPVTLGIGNDGEAFSTELEGHLPPAPIVLSLYESWQVSYRTRSSLNFRALKAPNAQITRQRSGLITLANELAQGINDWLNTASGFQKLRDQLIKTLNQNEDVRFIIQSNDPTLWQLPWHVWNVVQECPSVEVVLSPREFVAPLKSHLRGNRVRILVLLGDSTNIDIQTDLNFLQQLPNIELHRPTQLQREHLSDSLWTQRWDILFFAGHSSSQAGEGKIYLDGHTSLTIPELKHALRNAIAHGLQLAIFNSCDGLQLARDLAELQLPAAIVMREPIPDEAAQKFLNYFLQAFALREKSLYASVREARERLHGLEDKYPCVSWLPLICQHPATKPVVWRSFLPAPAPAVPVSRRSRRPKLLTVLTLSLAVTCAVLGIRMQGWLQPLELKAFDRLMQLRPLEGADPRLVVIGLTQFDVNEQLRRQERGSGSLSDDTLQKVIAALDKYQPRVIGIDILRDQEITSGFQDSLGRRLASSQKPTIVGICQFEPEIVRQLPGVTIERTGFSDVPKDRDGVTRFHQLSVEFQSNEHHLACQARNSLGLQLAMKYLAAEGIQPERTPEKSLKLGSIVFKRLNRYAGGYQNDPDITGERDYVLLNYRPYKNHSDMVTRLSLQSVLNGQVDAKLLHDKIVLIGRIDYDQDYWRTPYPVWEFSEERTPGVYLHAQATSQILSAVLDRRPLLWWLPIWGDGLWIGLWAAIGAILTRQMQFGRFRTRYWKLVGSFGTATCLLYGFCWLAMQQAGWLPLSPAWLSLGVSSMTVFVYWQRRR